MKHILRHIGVVGVITLHITMISVTVNTPTVYTYSMKVLHQAAHPLPTMACTSFPSRQFRKGIIGVHHPGNRKPKQPKEAPRDEPQMQSTEVIRGKYQSLRAEQRHAVTETQEE